MGGKEKKVNKHKCVGQLTRVQLKKALPLLQASCRMNEEERTSLFEYLSEEGRCAFYHCILNGVFNKFIPKKKQSEIREKLGHQKQMYEYLARGKKLEKKKKLLKQTGAGLPLILSSVLPILTDVLSPR